MNQDCWRAIEHVHGHLGWLAAALLVHPALLLRKPQRRAGVAVLASTALVTLAAALGLWLYVGYRAELKRGIFADAPAIGLLFERKEHLAFGAVMMAWCGAAAYFGAARAARSASDEELGRSLRTVAFRAFVAAATLAVLVAILGTWVAVYRSF